MELTTPGVAIVGCGLVGRKRAAALPGARLVACTDLQLARAQSLAAEHPGATAVGSVQAALDAPGVTIVVVATTNDALVPLTLAALRAGKHVLVEKPAAIGPDELDEVETLARERALTVRVGFNHRYHPALQRARSIVADGQLGSLMYVRGRYGHGGRVGYEHEWRADPTRSGGGELLDQGVHLIDLAAWFLGPFTRVEGFAGTFFWPMPVDDNAFLTLRTSEGRCAFLHVSCSEWKNLFSFEIYGRVGKLEISGLGGSYGVERLTWYRMRPEMGPPDAETWEFGGPDRSWADEFSAFLDDLRADREPVPGISEARAALQVVDTIYRTSGYRP